MEREQVYCV